MELKKQIYLTIKRATGITHIHVLRFFFAIVFFSTVFQNAKGQDLTKYHALFIGNFIKYVEWPKSYENLTVGVVGSSKKFEGMKKYLEREGKTRVRRIESPNDCSDCQIIFLPAGKEALFQPIKQAISKRDVLLVTEEERFASEGASISFFLLNGKLRFIVNKSVSEAHNLKISSGLLRMAKVI